MSLPAMLLDETMAEVLQASRFAKEIAVAAATKPPNPKITTISDPKTPEAVRRRGSKPQRENTELRARRTKEKRSLRRASRSASDSPPLPRARSRITFKSNSPLRRIIINSRPPVMVASRVSPRNKPWAKKTVLFPNSLFSSSSLNSKKFNKTGSPIIARTSQQRTPPHKFLIKTPPSSLKSQMKSKKVVPSPLRFIAIDRKVASPKARRCCFSPSKLANRLVSPLRSRISLQMGGSGLMSGLKQQPSFRTPTKIPPAKRI